MPKILSKLLKKSQARKSSRGPSYIELLKEVWDAKRPYLENYQFYAKQLAAEARRIIDPQAKVLVFGSAARGDWSPNSDIDVLVISDKLAPDWADRLQLRTQLKSKFRPASFQIHLATPQEFEGWYKNFIKNDFIRVA